MLKSLFALLASTCFLDTRRLVNILLLIIVGGLSWVLGNAEQLPVDDNSFDVYTVAFGIRNMTHIDKVRSFIYFLIVCFDSTLEHTWLCLICNVKMIYIAP